MKKNTINTFLQMKENSDKITMLTAYDYSTAKLLDRAGINSILVGDSLGMVMLGYEDTLQVTVDDIIHHCKAVSRGSSNALIVADMPFLSYHASIEDTIKNGGRIIQEGKAHCLKLEGGRNIIDKVEALIMAQIPVMGHIGLTPQSVNMMGGFTIQGREEDKAKQIMEDALLLEKAGVFAIVLEGIPGKLAKSITEELTIPTIGIGAGKDCDGQVLVTNDMLGIFQDFTPKFVKQYANLKDEIDSSVRSYIKDVKDMSFPQEKHTFK
ncbi:MAG: 3-methyl-2-oxobutanoate hydroxymethyltransferase [Epulopiscium sp.]|nr:3-methyl-2-oxobutanoate hydroxymethyltransferase [Candidatus Epulonipiscium sp.]